MGDPSILESIGQTPVINLQRYSPTKKVKILAKLEGNNPSGSIKDRIAFFMIKDAENKGLLRGKEIIEATSGNTGISLALVSAIRGYKFTAVMPRDVAPEIKRILKTYGAKIVLTNDNKGTDGAIEYVNHLARKNPGKYFVPNQFENLANVLAHYQTTGQEIVDQVPQITHLVAGMGTGGTLMGVGKRLRGFNPKIQVIGVEPGFLTKIPGLRNMQSYTPPIFNRKLLDETLIINKASVALELMKNLLEKEGVSAGISSGAALWGAIETSRVIKEGVIVVIFPDQGDRYPNWKNSELSDSSRLTKRILTRGVTGGFPS